MPSSPKKHLILHIGLHKTGSTAIQHFLHENAGELRRQKLFYPRSPGGTDHNALFRPGSSYPFGQAMRDFADAADCRTLLISSEDLSSLFLDAGRLQDIGRALRAVFEVTVVVYLRRQDHLKERVFAEIVKDWYVGSIYADNHYELNFHKRLSIIRNEFGRAGMRVRLYDGRTSDPRWLLQDFCGVAGIDVGRMILPENRPNRTLPRRKTLFLSQLAMPKGPVARRFVAFLSEDTSIADDGLHLLSPPRYRKLILEGQKAGNDRISQEFLDGAPMPVFDDEEDGAGWYEAKALSPSETMGVLGGYLETLAAGGRSL